MNTLYFTDNNSLWRFHNGKMQIACEYNNFNWDDSVCDKNDLVCPGIVEVNEHIAKTQFPNVFK